MARDEERLSPARQVQKELAHLDPGLRVQAVGRLVEDQHLGVMPEGAGDGYALFHAVTERFHVEVAEGSGPGCFEHLANPSRPFPPGDAERGPEEIEVLRDAHVVVRAEDIRHVAHQPLNLPRLGHAVHAGDSGRAAGGASQPDQDLDGRRLPGSVGPDEAKNLPALHGQRKTVQGHEFAILLRQCLGFEDGLTRTHV